MRNRIQSRDPLTHPVVECDDRSGRHVPSREEPLLRALHPRLPHVAVLRLVRVGQQRLAAQQGGGGRGGAAAAAVGAVAVVRPARRRELHLAHLVPHGHGLKRQWLMELLVEMELGITQPQQFRFGQTFGIKTYLLT